MTPGLTEGTTGRGFTEIREWRRHGSTEDVEAGRLKRLVEIWQTRCRPDGLLPARSDFSARELMSLGGIVSLIEVERNPLRFRIRLVGTHLTQAVGRDVSGRYADEVYGPEVYPQIFETYRQCVETRRPVWTAGRLRHAEKDFMRFESIDLPLAPDGQNVDMILKGTEMQQVAG